MPSKHKIAINNQQDRHPVATLQLRQAVRAVLLGEKIESAVISVGIVDDPTMHQLNRQYLKHDYPTDVLSFLLDREEGHLEGEIVVSADTAAESCKDYGWSAAEELVLYLIHGMLHIVGYDDHSAAERKTMRAKEKVYLGELGITPKTGRSKKS